MILNVSGRTDIVAFYTDWFFNRINEGFFDVRNPFNLKLISRINYNDVDAIMFCTKNPIPIVDRLKDINKPIVFHTTITPYKKDIEPNVIPKGNIIEAIKKLSDIIGIDNVYVRYDPIFLSEKYNINYHKKAFENMCRLLNGYVKNIIVSFIDDYKNVRRNYNVLKYRKFEESDYEEIGISFSSSVKRYGMTVQTCFEDRNLSEYGFKVGKCLSSELAFKLTGKIYKEKWKARKCNCINMVDIGVYNTCKHFCKYCYANYDEVNVKENVLKHYDDSSLLIGRLSYDDVIKERVR